MSDKVLIESYQPDPDGPTYGRIVLPDDMMKIQDYAHAHIEGVVRDLLMKNAPSPLVAGFAYTLPGGMNVSIAAGQAIDASGLSYDTMPTGSATVVTIPTAHPSLPRIDLILATLSANQDSNDQLLPHRRLRTQLELENGVPEYTPSNFNVPTERQNRASVIVRQGTPNASPVAPTAGAGEVALFQVRVEAGVTSITSDKVTDVRALMRSLRDAWAQIDTNTSALSGLNESIDDRVAVLIDAATYLTSVYDDPGNVLHLDVDLSALESVLDARYVNVTGDVMSGQLKSVNGGTDPNPSANTALHAVRAGGGASSPVIATYGYAEAGTNNGDVAYGGYFSANANRALAVTGTTSYGIYAETGAGATRWAAYLNGNVNVVGALSKGSGTFLIDHPVDPMNKDLVHGFVESREYLLVYRVRTQLVAGRATLDLDAALGFIPGTFARLTQDRDAFVASRGTAHVVGDITEGTPVDGISATTLTLQSEDDTDTSWVAAFILAARADVYIKTDPWVDSQGRLVAEHDKITPTQAELDKLAPVEIEVPRGSALAGQTQQETVPQLLGKRGYPRHPDVIPGATLPLREVTYTEASS